MNEPTSISPVTTECFLSDDDPRGRAHLADSPLRAAPERRRRRSADAITALHYQLSTTRTETGMDAVVLVDDRGCLVAGAGAWPLCEELAAYAPLLEDPSRIVRRTVSARIAELSEEAYAVSFDVLGSEVVLCGRGGGEGRGELLERAMVGIRRILRAA